MASGKISAPDSGFVEVVANGSKTYTTLMRELARIVDYNKLNANSTLSISAGGLLCTLNQKIGNVLRFTTIATHSAGGNIHGYQIQDNTDAGYFMFFLGGSSISFENKSNEKPANGTTFRIKY